MIQGGRGSSSAGRTFGPVWLGPDPVARGKLACVAEGRVDADVMADLGATSMAEAVIAAFERYGDAFPSRLHGELAFALWDGSRLTLGRDAFGIETMFWRGDRFSSELSSLGTSGRPDALRVAEHLTGSRLDGSRTFDAEIHELQPGCIWRDGAVSRWLDLRVDEDTGAVETIAASILEELRRAVTSRRPSGAVAVSLSGGIDSSAIAALLRDQQAPVRAVSVRWNHPAADERRFVRRLVSTGGFIADSLDGQDIDPFSARVLSICGPVMDPFAASTDALLSNAGATTFFGFDGDNVVSMGFESLADRLRAGRWVGAWAQADAVGRSYGLRPWELLRETAWPLLRPWRSSPAAPGWVSPALLREVGWDARVRALPHPRTQADDHLQALVGDDGRAMRTFVQLARARGLDARFPFMDVRLARRFLAVPTRHRLEAGFDRIMLRRAMAGVIPDDIRWRRGKAMMTLPITETLHRRLPPLDVEPVAAWVDVPAVRAKYARFLADPRPGDGWDLWRILGLATWYRHHH